MPELQISAVRTDSELMSFITFPWKVYQDNPYWVPPLLSERREFLDPNHNPFFDHATVAYFIARRGQKRVGTIAAFTNDLYNQFQEVNVGFFGFFEVLDDPEAAIALLSTAENWVRDAGHESIIGPAQFSTNDELGLLIDSFDDPPRILMTYNPPRYREYVEQAGYRKAMDLWSYAIKIESFKEQIPEKLLRVTEKVKQRRNLHVRSINMRDFDQEVNRFKRVYNSAWEKNWGFVPMTDPEINLLAKNLKQIVDPELVLMVEYEGEVVGVSLSLPDLCQPLLKAYPQPNTLELWTNLKLLWHWKVLRRIDWLRVFALGVHPDFRGLGIDALMYLETAKRAFPKGYQWAEMSWILESNEMMNRAIQFLGGKVYKTHRMYEKKV